MYKSTSDSEHRRLLGGYEWYNPNIKEAQEESLL